MWPTLWAKPSSSEINSSTNRFINTGSTSTTYDTLDHASTEFAARLHDEGFAADGRRFKLFTFSRLGARRSRVKEDRAQSGLRGCNCISNSFVRECRWRGRSLVVSETLALKRDCLFKRSKIIIAALVGVFFTIVVPQEPILDQDSSHNFDNIFF
jgi:hypothetical protein